MIESEYKILAGIIPSHINRMEKAQLNSITEDHFDSPQLRSMWKFMDDYYARHLAVMPEWALKERAESRGLNAGEVLALVDTYQSLAEGVVQDHEFNEALRVVKEEDTTRKLAEAIVTSREIIQDEYMDDTTGEILRGQEDARRYLGEVLSNLETSDAEAAPEGNFVDDMDAIWKSYILKEENPDIQGGIKYGIPELDDFTGGVRPGELALIAGFTGSGKASPLWTPVLTPSGWSPIGSLEVGDEISSVAGGTQTVKAVHDRGVMDTYRVTMKDGGSVLVGEDHLWAVTEDEDSDDVEVLDTKSIIAGMADGKSYYIPANEPIEFVARNEELPVIPYLFGGAALPVEGYISIDYLEASVQDRLELLQGLMDARGEVNPETGEVEFTTIHPQLVEDVRHLVFSLGGVVSIPVKVGLKHTFTLRLPEEFHPFKDITKLAQMTSNSSSGGRKLTRMIEKVEIEGMEEVRCITVSDPSSLYITEDFIVTHNSQMVSSLAWSSMCAGKNVIMFTTETTREEMEIRILSRHSRLPKFNTPGGINSHDILSGTLAPRDKKVFRAVLQDFREQKDYGKLIMVQMPTTGSVDYVYTKALQYNRTTPIDLLIVDSINLLRTSRRYQSKREMLEDMLQDFKRFASAFDNGRGVAVVSPWQMSRTAWKEAVDNGGVYSLASLSDTAEAERCFPNYVEVLTPKGFIPISDLKVGDTIAHPDGSTQTVEDVHVNTQELPIYLVSTDDGSLIPCTPGHLWNVRRPGDSEWQTLTAAQIKAEGGEWEIPINTYYDFGTPIEEDGSLDPLLLGSMTRSSLSGTLEASSKDEELIVDGIYRSPHLPDPEYGVRTSDYTAFLWNRTKISEDNPYWEDLEDSGLLNTPIRDLRIPRKYLNSALHSRISYLTGADSVYPEIDHVPAEMVPHFYGDLKHLLMGTGTYPFEERSRKIVSIEDTGTTDLTRCITVSSPDGLYVVDDFVVTHNSSSQIVTMFKDNDRVNLQILKNRGGREMPKVSYKFDYRNSYIGSSDESGNSGPDTSRADASMTSLANNIRSRNA